MRPRPGFMLIVMAVVLAACSHAPPPTTVAGRAFQVEESAVAAAPPVRRIPPDVLIVGAGDGVASIDPVTGSVLFRGAGVPSLTDWSELFATSPAASGTTALRVLQPDTGDTVASLNLSGDLAIRAVSADGERVALMAPLRPEASPWIPEPRDTTDIVVADPTGYRDPLRFHLKGNFEPEAFSSDGWSLYMIRYIPPTAPVAYRVARLDLMDGTVSPVFGRDKAPAETMSGTRLTQVSSPDGSMLYTLYSTQPPKYANGHDAAQARANRSVAFVHTLSLAEGWAICLGLPMAFWGGDPRHQAIAVSPNGHFLFVADTERGVVTALDTGQLELARTARVDLGPVGNAPAHMAVSPDGSTLFLTTGSGVVSLDAQTLDVTRAWTIADPVSGVGVSSDGRSLYVAVPDGVQTIDASTGRMAAMVPVWGVDGIRYVGPIVP